MFQGRQPTNAEIAALLGLGNAPAPSMARPQFSFPTPRFVPTGSIKATPKSISGSIQATIAKGLQKVGVGDRQAHRFASRTMLPLTDTTPIGNVTGAEEGKNTFKRGLTKGELGTMGLGAASFLLSAAPLPGAIKRGGKKLGTGMFGSMLKDKSGGIRGFHGTTEIFDEFDPSRANGLYFFSDNPDTARIYGHRVKEADLDFRNPLSVPHVADTSHIPALAERAKVAGHDGLIIENIDDVGGPQRQLVAFSPPRLHNAAGNDATDVHSLVGMLTDPRPTYSLYREGDVLKLGGQRAEVVGEAGDNLVVLTPSGRRIVARNDPNLSVAPHSEW